MDRRETKPIYIYALYLLGNIAAAMTWPVTTIYLTQVLHRTYLESGFVLMIGSVISMAASWISGILFDRWKPYKALMISLFISLIAMIGMFFIHIWPLYPLFLWINNIGFGMQGTLTNSYAAVIGEKNAKQFFSNMAIFLNIGVVIGTFAGTYLFGAFSIHGTMALGILLLILMIITQFIGVDKRFIPARITKEKPERLKPNKLLWSIGALLFIAYLAYQLWETVISPHMINLGMTVEQYGWLWIFNGFTIIILQNFITKLTRKWSYNRSTVIGVFIFAISFPPLIWANQFWQYILIFEVLTIGEMLFTPSVSAWISKIVDNNQLGQAMAFSSASISIGRAVGPIYAGVFMDRGWIFALFMSIFVGMLIAISVVWYFAKKKSKTVI
jgi:MFS family permease